ncbi:MAG: flavodoxin domain-containing protein, partial [Candidatus Delongbacteria bacterium]
LSAPSHGPIYDKPEVIIEAYRDWTSDKVKKEVLIPYVSMHGSTKLMADYLTGKLIEKGFSVKQFNLPVTDVGELAMSLVDASTIIIGSPIVLAGAHPAAVYAAFLANALRPKTKFVSIFGSFGWGGKMVEQLSGLIGNLKVEVIEPVLFKGMPREEDYRKIDAMVETLVEKHKSL